MITIGLIGQSHLRPQWFLWGSTTALPNVKIWDNVSAFIAPTGAGDVAFGNLLATLTGDDIQMVNGAISGTALSAVADSGQGFWDSGFAPTGVLPDFLTLVSDAAVTLDAVLFVQGGTDAVFGTPQNTYLASLKNLLATLQGALTLPNLPMVLSLLGRNEDLVSNGAAADADDAFYEAIRSAQRRGIVAFDKIHRTSDNIDLLINSAAGHPFAHYNQNSEYTKHGERAARTVAELLGFSSPNQGPTVVSVQSVLTTRTRLELSIADFSFAGLLATGIEFSDDLDFTVPIAATATTKSGRFIDVDHAAMAAPSERRYFRYMYGANPDHTVFIFDTNVLPLQAVLMSNRKYIGLHVDDPNVGDLTNTTISGTDRSISTAVELIHQGNPDQRILKLGFNGRSDSAVATADANLFVLESPTPDFTACNVVANVDPITIVAGDQDSDLAVYEADIPPYEELATMWYGIGSNNASAAQDQWHCSTSKAADNGDIDYTLGIDTASTTDGSVPLTYNENASVAGGRVMWALVEALPPSCGHVLTAAGTQFAVSPSVPATHDEAGFAALTFTDIAEVVDGGSAGKTFNKVDHSPLGEREVLSIKGSFGEGIRTLQLGRDATDAGQVLLLAGLEVDEPYSFEITYQNGDIDYLTATIDSYTDDIGTIDTIVSATVALAQCNPTIRVLAA